MRVVTDIFRVKSKSGAQLMVVRDIIGRGRPATKVFVVGGASTREPTQAERQEARAAIANNRALWKRNRPTTVKLVAKSRHGR